MKNTVSNLCLAGAFLLLSNTALFSQTTYERQLGLASDQAVLATDPATGGFLVVGDSLTATGKVACVMRLDAAGQTLGAHTLDLGVPHLQPEDLVVLADGRFGLAGTVVGGGNDLAFLGILNANGQLVAEEAMASGSGATWQKIAPTADQGLVVTGRTQLATSRTGGLIARYNSQLDTVWTRTISLADHNITLASAAELPSGDLVVGGFSKQSQGGNQRAFLMRFTAAGGLVWLKQFYTSAYEVAAMAYDGADHIYLAGRAVAGVAYSWDHMSLMALDTTGDILWGKTLLDFNTATVSGLHIGAGNSVLLYGHNADSLNDQNGVVAAFSPSGDLLWTNVADEGATTAHVVDVARHPSGGYLWMTQGQHGTKLLKVTNQGSLSQSCGLQSAVAGSDVFAPTLTPLQQLDISAGLATSPITASSTACALRNELLCLFVGIDPAQARPTASVHPQPMYSTGHIRMPDVRLGKDAQLLCYNSSGIPVPLAAMREADGFVVERGTLSAGLYFFHVVERGRRVASGKLLVQD